MNANPTPEPVPRDDLDRLADGSLPDECRARVLRDLDREPDGWKRCATAFLEAQLWGEAFRREEAHPRVGRRWPAPLAVVAATLLGFAAATVVVRNGPANGGPAAGPAGPVSTAILPVTVASGLVPATDDRGRLYYVTRGDVPPFILKAVEQAGHRIEYHDRVVTLDREDGGPLELPLTETRILVNHSL